MGTRQEKRGPDEAEEAAPAAVRSRRVRDDVEGSVGHPT